MGTSGEKIENCYNTGDVQATTYIGGICGGNVNSVANCFNTGNLKGGFIGGICQSITVKIINCYNTGVLENVEPLNGSNLGGIVYQNKSSGVEISNSFNCGKMISPGRFSGIAAGILGTNSGDVKINNCYSIGEVELKTGGGQGIVGSNSGTVTLNKCYYLKTTSVTKAIGGTDDDTTVVTACTNQNEITADILNDNIDNIEHTDEWKKWKMGEDGYPIFE